jgi:CheY-like chemotaxis protein
LLEDEKLPNNNILWVEDECDKLWGLMRPLIRKGYRITAAKSAKEALISLHEKVFDLIILDLIIPAEDDQLDDFENFMGLRLAKKIVKDLRIATPIIVLSVVVDSDIYDELRSLGVKRIIPKGVCLPSHLLQVVRDILEN